MRVTKIKSTGKIFEASATSHSETLIANAKQYFPESDIEIIEMTQQEVKVALTIQDENDKSPERKKEDKIKKEEKKILRQLAIDNLKSRGEIS